MKAKRKEKLIKGFLILFLCFCFVGFTETLQANYSLVLYNQGPCNTNPRKICIDEVAAPYRKACDGGDLEACNQLGHLEYARDIKSEEAKIAYQKSCDGGNPVGCNNFEFLEYGNIDRDERATILYHQEGCNGGDFSRCTKLGDLEYFRGKIKEAVVTFKKSCDGGNFDGCWWLGYVTYQCKTIISRNDKHETLKRDDCIWFFGGERVNIKEVVIPYRRACTEENFEECNKIGYLELGRDWLEEAKFLFKKSCDGGNLDGCVGLGLVEQRDNIEKAASLYRKACDGENLNGCNKLGNLEYDRGNHAEAELLYRKTCAEGNLNGCNHLGHLEQDRGNLEEAALLYRKTCDGGNFTGCRDLRRLESSRKEREKIGFCISCIISVIKLYIDLRRAGY